MYYHKVVEPYGIPGYWVLLHCSCLVQYLQVTVILPRVLEFLTVQLCANFLLTVCVKDLWPALHHSGVSKEPFGLCVVTDMQHLNKSNTANVLGSSL